MFRVVSWTCTFLVLASARVYDRCELARELLALGVESDDISTWVCIAYHESRLDTAAQNYGSGDHGIFQISELYWCGQGKACGLPCSDLRNDDISDDLKCALHVKEEHDRLQGNGFLAWVVYSQNCKHNTKKYIIDCDSQMKNVPLKTITRSGYPNLFNSTGFPYYSNIESLKPPYLAKNSISRGQVDKVLQANDRKSAPYNWLNYKVDNIDDLSLPVFNNNRENGELRMNTARTSYITTSTIATTTAYRRNYVEAKQFRKKIFIDDVNQETVKNSSPSYVNDVTPEARRSVVTTTTIKPTTSTTTLGPFTTRSQILKSNPTNSLSLSTVASTTRRPMASFTSTVSRTVKSTTAKPFTNTFINTKALLTTARPHKPIGGIMIITERPVTRYTPISTTIESPKTISKTNNSSPFRTTKSISSIKFKPTTVLSEKSTTTTTVTALIDKEKDGEPRAYSNLKLSNKSISQITTRKPSIFQAVAATASTAGVTESATRKTTQSIFDLYLNPTKTPQLRTYKFPQFDNSAYKLKIFSDGTTTPATKASRDQKSSLNARNFVRRQT